MTIMLIIIMMMIYVLEVQLVTPFQIKTNETKNSLRECHLTR